MKINWKEVSKSKGYKSLKAAYIESRTGYKHKRKEAAKLFPWIISRATHFAYHKNVTLDVILDEWEAKRANKYWSSFYYEHDQMFKKLHNRENVQRIGIKGYKKSVYQSSWGSKESNSRQVFTELLRIQRINSKRYKNKPRWNEDYKAFAKRQRARGVRCKC